MALYREESYMEDIDMKTVESHTTVRIENTHVLSNLFHVDILARTTCMLHVHTIHQVELDEETG